MKIDPQYISLIIAALGVLISYYVSSSNSKKADINDAVANAKETTKISTKLDGIAQDVRETARNVEKMNDNLTEQGKEIVRLDQSVRSAHHRIDGLVEHVNKISGYKEVKDEKKKEKE